MSGGRAEIAPSGDARIAMKSPKTGGASARSDVRGRTARGEIMLEQRTRREPLRECELDGEATRSGKPAIGDAVPA